MEQHILQQSLYLDIGLNIAQINTIFGHSSDIVTGELCLDAEANYKIGYVYLEQLVNNSAFQDVTNALLSGSAQLIETINTGFYHPPDLIRNTIHACGKVQTIEDFHGLCQNMLTGETVILIDGYAIALSVNTAGGDMRSVEEPSTQSVVRGPRDGFTESIGTNISLIRKRIKSPNLWLETMAIGRVTQTTVSIMYINGIVNDKIVEEIHRRLA